MIIKNVFIFLLYLFLALPINSEPNLDQWKDTEKTYYDLIQEGFEVNQIHRIEGEEVDIGHTFFKPKTDTLCILSLERSTICQVSFIVVGPTNQYSLLLNKYSYNLRIKKVYSKLYL